MFQSNIDDLKVIKTKKHFLFLSRGGVFQIRNFV